LHEKIIELHSRIVSLEADLKVPIHTSCSTCEWHAMKNLELAQFVNIIHDEKNKLCEVLSWLSGQEPQLGMMIASCKRFDGWALGFDKVVEGSGEREGKFGMFQLHLNRHPRTSLRPSQTSCLTREKNRARR
jgi:hypothetical protein